MRGTIPSFSGFTCFHPSFDLGPPRVAIYVDLSAAMGLAVSVPSASSPLLMEVVLSALLGICTLSQKTLKVINLYNPPLSWMPAVSRLYPSIVFHRVTAAILVAGDFNIHHYNTDTTRAVSHTEFITSNVFFTVASEGGFTILNN